MPILDWLAASGSRIPGNASGKSCCRQQALDMGVKVRAEFSRFLANLGKQTRPAVDNGDYVFEVVTKEIASSSPFESFDFLARKNALMILTSRSSVSCRWTADLIARRYQRFENQISSLRGMTSSTTS